MITTEQYDKLKFMHTGRRALTYTEINAMWDVASQSGLNPGCKSCPESVQLVIKRVHHLIDEYRSKVKQEEQDTKKNLNQDQNASPAIVQTDVKSGQMEQSEIKTAPSSKKTNKKAK